MLTWRARVLPGVARPGLVAYTLQAMSSSRIGLSVEKYLCRVESLAFTERVRPGVYRQTLADQIF